MNAIQNIAVSAVALALGSHDNNIELVKNNSLSSCPDYTIEEMVDGFFADPEWKAGKASNGKFYVNVSGHITYNYKPSKVELQFEVSQKKNNFNLYAWSLDGKPISENFVLNLMDKMCETALNNFAEKMIEAFVAFEEMESELKDNKVFQLELGRLKEICNEDQKIKSVSENTRMIDMLSCVEKNTKNQYLKHKVIPPLENSIKMLIRQEHFSEHGRNRLEKIMYADPRMAKQKTKTQASIVMPAAGSFKKLQEAYAAETAQLGSWNEINFTAVESSVFDIEEISKYDIYGSGKLVTEGIRFLSKEFLGDCPIYSTWTLQCQMDESQNVICSCNIGSNNESACQEIIPDFTRLCD